MGSHKMETSLKAPRRRRPRKKKRKADADSVLNSSQHSTNSRTENLGVKNVTIKKKRTGKVKEVTKQFLNSIIDKLREQRASLCQNQKKDCDGHGQPNNNLLDQTVDLCDDSFVNDSSSSVVIPSFKKNEVIDLSNDLTEPKEVVDLTEPYNKPSTDCNEVSVLEPTVIDLCEEESKEKSSLKPENDDIFVIGTYSKHSKLNEQLKIPIIQLSNRLNNFNNIINCSDKLKRKYLKRQSVLDKIDNRSVVQYRCESQWQVTGSSSAPKIGENIYVASPVVLPSCGLRPIIIDGSNVAFVHSNSNFSCRRLEICINYFKEKGHKVTAFVPQFRLSSHRSDDPQLLRKLERQGDVILTPSKKIDGRNIVPYDDRFIVQTAVLKGGIIVTRDNYNDLLKENPAWAETIKYRTLAFTWVDDVLMFPKDPLGEFGPSLEQFLRFQ